MFRDFIPHGDKKTSIAADGYRDFVPGPESTDEPEDVEVTVAEDITPETVELSSEDIADMGFIEKAKNIEQNK